MAKDRTLLPDPFFTENATEFWRRLETYLEYKRSDNGDNMHLATAVLVLTAMNWFDNLPKERNDTFAHLQAAFAEKFIQPAILKWQTATDTLQINVKKLNSLKQCLTATRPTSHN